MGVADTDTLEEELAVEGGSKKKIVVIAVVGVVAAIAALYLLVLSPSDAEAGPPEPMFSLESGPILRVDEATVSLGGSEPHFAAVTYSVEIALDADPALVEAGFARLRSQAQRLFRAYEAQELKTAAGFDRLEADLTRVATELWPDGEVLRAYVESLLVQ
ncbi:MAG: flagellar basal body-associated protein FliL [Myxococcota bacterium]